jgi:hypothetical protein
VLTGALLLMAAAETFWRFNGADALKLISACVALVGIILVGWKWTKWRTHLAINMTFSLVVAIWWVFADRRHPGLIKDRGSMEATAWAQVFGKIALLFLTLSCLVTVASSLWRRYRLFRRDG